MRQFRELPYDLAERLELPEELLPSAGRLTVCAGRRAVIEGARGILEYSADCVTVSFGRQKLRLRGDALLLRAMSGRELLVTGRIRTAEWE